MQNGLIDQGYYVKLQVCNSTFYSLTFVDS